MKLGIFGSIHSAEMMKEFGFDDDKVIELFDNFKPDIICGEVRKVDYEQDTGYRGPSEYRRFIFDYCEKNNIKFVPCDSYDDSVVEYMRRLDRIDNSDNDTAARWRRVMERYIDTGKESKIPFNSPEFNALVAQKQALQEAFDPKAQEIAWNRRNTGIVNNIMQVIKDNPGANVLVVFGAEHTYWLCDAFEKEAETEVVFPLCLI